MVLIISEPEMANKITSGCKVAGPSSNEPQYKAPNTRSACAAHASTPTITMLVGMGVPSKYLTFAPPSESCSAVTLKRAKRLTPQATKYVNTAQSQKPR